MVNFFTQLSSSVKEKGRAFFDRNKYKLAGLGLVAGGVWYYYGDTLKQAWEMYKLIQGLQATGETETPTPTTGGDTDESEESFVQTVATADETAQRQLHAIRLALAEMYASDMEKVQAALRSPMCLDRESQFANLHALCYSKLTTAVLLTEQLLLVSRVAVCLIGRANRGPTDDEARIDHRELLSALRAASSKETITGTDSVVRTVVKEVFELASLVPTKQCAVGRTCVPVDNALARIAVDAVDKLRSDGGWTSLLLGKLASKEEGDQSEIFKEALDVLESPQFKSVLVRQTQIALSLALARSIPEDRKATKSTPLAALMPGIRAESDNVTTPSSVYVERVREDESVTEFSKAVYFADSSSSSSAGIDDDSSAQLGQLLEKLVKADMRD